VSPDWSAGPATVPYAHLDNPQTLNLYSYVDNNPVNGIDADGHAISHAFDGLMAGLDAGPPANEGGPTQTQSAITLAGMQSSAFGWQLQAQQTQQAQQVQNQSQTQTRQLTADDVSKGIKAFDSDKEDKNPGRVVKALDTMGKDFTVSGDTLRQGVKDSGLALPKDAGKVLANVESITRTGNNVVITNKDSMTIKGAGQLAKTISFTINPSLKGKSGYVGPALQNLNGVGIGWGKLAYHPNHWGPE
jgi:hypothetical protein